MTSGDREKGTDMGHDDTDARPTVKIASPAESRDTLALRAESLPDAERQEASRYLRAEDRDRFLLGRLILRDLIHTSTGLPVSAIVLKRDSHGRPFLPADPDLDVNLSHSGDRVAAAVGRGLRVGIDVEQHRTGLDIVAIGRQVFTPYERAVIAAAGSGALAAFFTQWTLKEALIKALGRGFLDDPRRIEIRREKDGIFQPHFVGSGPDDLGHRWRLQVLECGDHHSGALAFRARPSP
ncbi:4'-phosphopantetheinyl transferase [Rhizobium sp. RU20A]|uniref:4'-phosphopantetheinyl transferase family protein n=1 Tax=Rhizobium sp. RU20A TaxID=1907412 RepID=UPI000955C333|nr:4'-phosphopantetheinyl transferase superfamily protein [Rhizobium sp. RU20A]SIR32149.1 4'-phosphopantetheinyl transferase [Rhizobium sp. RU20A]